jgi:hypothetical protein
MGIDLIAGTKDGLTSYSISSLKDCVCLLAFIFAAGKLDKAAVLRAICSGYQETTDPPVCLSDSVETNECLTNNGGCWSSGNITACKACYKYL